MNSSFAAALRLILPFSSRSAATLRAPLEADPELRAEPERSCSASVDDEPFGSGGVRSWARTWVPSFFVYSRTWTVFSPPLLLPPFELLPLAEAMDAERERARRLQSSQRSAWRKRIMGASTGDSPEFIGSVLLSS